MIIVLCGVRGSGKDTIGDILAKNHGFTKEAFANPLKAMVKHAFPAFTDTDLYGPSKNREREYKQYPFSGDCVSCGFRCQKIDDSLGGGWICPQCGLAYPDAVNARVACQALGTAWGRRLYRNVWIDACFERIRYDTLGKHMINPTTGTSVTFDEWAFNRDWVITDGRFRNEVRRSRELGGITVRLDRGLSESTDPHPSEAELRTMVPEEFDVLFDNSRFTLEDLPLMVKNMVDGIKNRKINDGKT
jgi:hypothetical protein